MSTPDLFPDTALPADPLSGRPVCIATVCWRCGTNVALINPRRGPHAAELRCRNCDEHVQWLSHADYETIVRFFAEFENKFGAQQLFPATGICGLDVRRGWFRSLPRRRGA